MNKLMGALAWTMVMAAACNADGEADALRDVMANLRGMVEYATDTTALVAGPSLEAELAEQAPELLAKGNLRDVAAASRWHGWQETLMTLDAAGRRGACRTATTSYLSLRRAFQDAQSSNNVRAMCILAFEADFTYRQIQSLLDNEKAMGAPLPVASPRDLRAVYDAAVGTVRKDWMTAQQPSRAQAAAINQIVRADSLATLVAFIEAARSNEQSAVSIAWLAQICQALAFQDPINFSYWYGGATCQRLTGDIRAENETWRQALAVFPDAPYAHFRLACTCGQGSRQATRAIVHLRWLMSRVKGELWQIRIQNEFARRYVQLGSYKEAAACIADAVKRSSRNLTPATVPLYTEARKIESDSLLRQGKPDEALRALEDAAVAAPEDTAVTLAAANTLFGLAAGAAEIDAARVETALLWYDKVLRTQPRCAAVHGRKAYLNMLLCRWNPAQAEAVTELTIEPRSVCALTVLGLCYLAGGDAANALVFFNKALDIDPTCAAAHNGRDLAKAAVAAAPAKQKDKP